MKSIELWHGDCLELMSDIEDESVDVIIADVPYGTTSCKWDTVIPFEPMWEQVRRLIKPSGAIVMTASQPFTSALVMSNVTMFKYSLVWKKRGTNAGFAQAPYRFLKEHEDIVVFSYGGTSKNAKNRMVYNPQGLKDCKKVIKGRSESAHRAGRTRQNDYIQNKTGYPKSILEFGENKKWFHSAQKPIELMEYLIKTYSDNGDTVLDFACGSGSTLVAASNLNRNGIGIDNGFCDRDRVINGIQINGLRWVDISQLRLDGKFA